MDPRLLRLAAAATVLAVLLPAATATAADPVEDTKETYCEKIGDRLIAHDPVCDPAVCLHQSALLCPPDPGTLRDLLEDLVK